MKTNKIRKKRSKKKICVAYAVSGIRFQKCLVNIAKNNKDFDIHFFFKTKPYFNLPPNVFSHFTSRIEFLKKMQKASCVLCTSGNELILECVLNKIPVATMFCSNKQWEQIKNQKKYVDKFKYATLMHDDINLDDLSKLCVKKQFNHLKNSLKNREKKLISYVEKFI